MSTLSVLVWQILTNTKSKLHVQSFQNTLLAFLNFVLDVNFSDQNGHRPEFQLEIPLKFKTGVIS